VSYNFINEAATIRTSPLCYYDNTDGYSTDFTVNGDTNGWDYWDGFHTYGCWDNFIFGTLYGSYALIGRTTIFYPVPAEDYYFIKITMKINPSEREGIHVLPTTGRVQWATTADSSWNSTKSYDFDIDADNEWHTYVLNVGELQYWQGDVDNLRIYPIYEDGQAGDEFFIKSIKIISLDTYRCNNINCSYYTSYEHPCPGIGTKGYCKSSQNSSTTYTVEEDVNDEFIVNINDYGNETIKLDVISNATGPEIAKILTRNISRVGIGGYSEVEIVYTDDSEFIIYSGTYTTTSTVVVVDSTAARLLGFFNSTGVDLSSKTTGTLPATGAESASSFKIKSFQTLTLFDNTTDTFFYFDPSLYNVEGGRSDWLVGGLGVSNVSVGWSADTHAANTVTRNSDVIDNANKTIIDFNHPFNASGRVKKIYAACTLDQGYEDMGGYPPATSYEGRLEATGCKVLIIRPKRNGNLEVVDSIDIPDRNYSGGRLYSYVQESIDLDCDVWVNKGDLLGIYNANMYTGKSISGDQVDALYYQVDGEVTGEFDPGEIYGEGMSGLLIYARSDKKQDKLVLDVDLGDRVNIEDINIIGTTDNVALEYNIARCLDINWSVDLFGGMHQTGYKSIYYYAPDPQDTRTYEHLNVAYGVDKLSDGVRIVPDGYAGSGYIVGDESYAASQSPDLTTTFVVTDPQYFFVNGDQEWLGIYQHKQSTYAAQPFVQGFNEDPVAFTLLFPYGLNKTIYKSVIYFKEKWNFRNFALSVTYDLNGIDGDADDVRFNYLSEYSAVTIDNQRVALNGHGYDSVEKYLFVNPSRGEPVFEFSGARGPIGEYLGVISNYEEYTQASNLDWTYLSHEFEPVECKGFRFYCDYHYSTKITEMELYCRVEDIGTNLVGGMSVSYSHYEDLWWQASLDQDSDTSVTADIKDTPRYFLIEIEPITKMTLNEVIFNVKQDELYVGQKGCEYQVLPIEAKTDATNAPQITYVKNIYNSDYDLYVNIADDNEAEDRLVFHTKLNSEESVTNPEIGPDAVYHKSDDYPLVGTYKNCAINSECWGLRNLIDGKQSYYSYDNGYSWSEFGTLSSGVSIDFTNVPVADTSTLNIPVISRNRYWKLVWLAEDHPDMNVREMVPFYDGQELDCTFYHEKTLAIEDGPMTDTAPHLRNSSVIGSYYKLDGTKTIGMDFGAQEAIDKLIWFHDSIPDYNILYCGIDKYTKLNLTIRDFDVIDYSYDERPITISNAEAGTGKWDFDFNEVPTVSGLCLQYDPTPTSSTLGDFPELVDGTLWTDYTVQNCTSSYYYPSSYGVDLGSPKKVHMMRFYIYTYPTGTLNGSFLGNYIWYVYKSNDNVNWTLTHESTTNPIITLDSGYNASFDFYLPSGPTARYFKMYSSSLKAMGGNNQYFQCSEIKTYVEEPNSYKTGIGFDGNSSITVPASDDFVFPGTSSEFTIDFHVEFNSLPIVSGTDYCTMIRNWPDVVSTVKFGDIPYPPEDWMANAIMEQGGVGIRDSNYAVLVRPLYNLARAKDAAYSSSNLGWGYAYNAFDGDFSTTGALNPPIPSWFKVILPEAKKVTRYGLYSYYGGLTTNSAKDFELQAYITASGTWIPLHSVTNHLATEYEMQYYTFSNPYPACTQYRLYITANYGGSYTIINEIELFDDSYGATPSLYQMEAWFQSSNPANYAGGTVQRWSRQSAVLFEGGHHVNISRYSSNTSMYVNGELAGTITSLAAGFNSHSEDLIIGENLDGVISDMRITKGVRRTDYLPKNWHINERYYTLSLYVSEDDIAYGKYCDLDLYKDNSHSYYYSDNVFSSDYYSMLAIDLENRYDLELIRDYGASDAQPFSIYGDNSYNVYYSNDEVSDIMQVNWSTRSDYDNYITLYAGETVANIGKYPTKTSAARSFTAVDCTGLTKENGLLVIDLSLYYDYYTPWFDTTIPGRIEISSSAGVSNEVWYYILTPADLVRIDVSWTTFYLPLNYFETTGDELDVSQIDYIRTYWYGQETSELGVYGAWQNARVAWPYQDALTVADDARWIRFDLLSGDGEDRIIRELGVYPDISTQLSPGGGHYNHEWDYLGKSVTAYESSANLALGATVSGSSYFGLMVYQHLTDGVIDVSTDTGETEESSTFYTVWGSEDEAEPWVSIDLGAEYSVYRFKIYHGYNDGDTDYMATDYEVQTSTDNQTYDTQFTITNNSSFERTHDLTLPVQARYVKIAITGYDTKKIVLKTDYERNNVDFFEGAVMREIEVYEYYGYPVISSEQYPIVAVDMLDQFYLSSHSIVGVDAEDTTADWDNNDRNFCYSDSVLDATSKVDFREWNEAPGYDRWAVVKMNSATDYRGGPHYLKHIRITSSDDQNPCDYPWWWQSSVSTLSRDYNQIVSNSTSALKIEYPASTTIDSIEFIEGDHFSVDTSASWRDGFNFRIRIDDVDNLDRSYGYFYLGGYDYTAGANPVIYKWYMSTLSGSLDTGWNNMFLRFKAADEIEYTESDEADYDLRIIRNVNLGTMGMVYRGVGNELTMHFDGFKIERNRFYDYSAHAVGAYLNNNDYITAPIGEYDMSKGTIEFWIRPDYNYRAADYYGVMHNRAIFSFNNNANDVFGLMIGYNGFEIYFGNTSKILNVFSLEDLGLDILDVMFHMGIVFSNDGTQIASDGSTFRLYFNNYLIFKSTETWSILDNKHFTFILGGTAPLNLKVGTYIETSSVDAVISDFKIYNYCKTDFYNSMRNVADGADKLIKPSNFVALSKDNLTYYKIREAGLPLVYNNVLPGVSVPVYVKMDIPDGLTGKEIRTAGLKIYWDIAV